MFVVTRWLQLDYNVTESKLKEVFRMAGRIVDAEIRYDKEGKSRGIGLVKYEYPMEAVQAICILHALTVGHVCWQGYLKTVTYLQVHYIGPALFSLLCQNVMVQ